MCRIQEKSACGHSQDDDVCRLLLLALLLLTTAAAPRSLRSITSLLRLCPLGLPGNGLAAGGIEDRLSVRDDRIRNRLTRWNGGIKPTLALRRKITRPASAGRRMFLVVLIMTFAHCFGGCRNGFGGHRRSHARPNLRPASLALIAGRGAGIRTRGLFVPNEARYQAAPLPVSVHAAPNAVGRT